MRALLLLTLIVLACRPAAPGASNTQGKKGKAAGGEGPPEISKVTHSGPVTARVSISPPSPQLGDPITLVLTVEAEPQVSVEMPPFGEALGRFAILSFTPRSETLASGASRHSHRYLLEAPMSGRQRIPPLRVEFLDHRPGRQGPDGGAAAHELLTDEISLEIASVLPSAEVKGELRGLRPALPETFASGKSGYIVIGAGVLALLLLGWPLARALRRRSERRARVSAYDVAMERLGGLARRGVPAPQSADAWYVDLSDVVRRYIEDRYAVRAPELTTEEFLREARNLLDLHQGHRDLLATFLTSCDRVKFAAYKPAEAESEEALAQARRFIEETRDAGPAEGRP